MLGARGAVVVMAVGALLLRWPAGWVERYYSRGLYPAIQHMMTPLSNFVPVAMLDLAIVAAAAVVVLAPLRIWRAGRGRRLRATGRFVENLVSAAAAVYLGFVVAWGLNYQREPITSRVDYDDRRVTPEAVEQTAMLALEQLRALSGSAPGPARPLSEVAGTLAARVDDWAASLGLDAVVVPGRPKHTLLDAYFTRAGVSGMTDPLFLETLVASDLLPFEQPAVIAHEWAHLAGWARESEASFAGFVLCMRVDDRARYSGWFELFLELYGSLDADGRKRVQARLPDGVTRDLRAMAERNQRNRKPMVSLVAWKAYDSYLKSQRVDSGVRNYSEVVRLVLGTRFDADWRPARRR